MKVLMVHNRYQQRGGEDAVVDAEVALLRSNGIEVRRLDADNDSIQGIGKKVQVSLSQFGLPVGQDRRLSRTLAEFRPDIVHVHNWFPTLTASVFRTCQQAQIPVVHTLHNYRLLCANATLFRDGHVCEDCIGTLLRTPGLVHKCYKGSLAGSAVATAGMLAHWGMGTWHRSVDKFIALTEFARLKMIQGGLPEEKIAVKPNFVEPDPGPGSGFGGYFVYAGRLAEEKGLRTLLQCWTDGPRLPLLKIVGTGPLESEVKNAAENLTNVEYCGSVAGDKVMELMADSLATICPSLWFEGMPRVVIESLAVGTPVIASRIGCYPEMIVDTETGALFPAGDAIGLGQRIRDLLEQDSLKNMRAKARRRFESEYSGSKNLLAVLSIYRSVMYSSKLVSPPAVPALT
jgi:glycosyltransferase involved in cell wall biosynthesis